MNKDWILFLRKKYSMTSLEMEEYIVSFNYLNNGNPITPNVLMDIINIYGKDELLEWDAITIINHLNKSVRNNESLPNNIDLYTYLLFIIPLTRKCQRQKININKLFDYFDMDHDGQISIQEFKDALLKMCKPMSPKEYSDYNKKIKKIIKKADLDNNGYLNKKEFIQFIKDNKLIF